MGQGITILGPTCANPPPLPREEPRCTAIPRGHFSWPSPRLTHHQKKTGGGLVGAPKEGLVFLCFLAHSAGVLGHL